MVSEWDEIKRLAADFQRAQTSDTLQKISERNCIDIVKKLTELSLIDLIYTCDGKEFITPAHLAREIEDEVYVNGGRMHLHDLASKLNVDYNHVESAAEELVRDKPDEYCYTQGQIIHNIYQTTLSKRISDTMLATGQLSIAEFAKSMDLPADFLLTKVKEILPKLMDNYIASQDERTYYSADMMDRYKSVIAGTLSAITKPISLAAVMKRLAIPERIFTPLVEGLLKEGRIDATIDNRTLVPSSHTRNQNEWVDTFYKSNNYIEYDTLTRMDIKQPKSVLKKRYPEGTQLKTCFINREKILSQVEPFVEDAIATKSWVDLSTMVPSAIEDDDIELLVQFLFDANKNLKSSCFLVNKTFICSFGFLETQRAHLGKLMQSEAQKQLLEGRLADYFIGPKPKETPSNKIQDQAKSSDGVESNLVSVEDREAKTGAGPEPDQGVASDQDVKADQEDGAKFAGKKGRRDKKDKKSKGDDFDEDADHDSNDDTGPKKSKGSRKSGGGTQGREIKQKAVKKKYIPGNKGNQNKGDDLSDEDTMPAKTPKSNKSRAARRAISPERPAPMPTTSKKASREQKEELALRKEPLVFLSEGEIHDILESESRAFGDCSREFVQAIANKIGDLSSEYIAVAKKVFDESEAAKNLDE